MFEWPIEQTLIRKNWASNIEVSEIVDSDYFLNGVSVNRGEIKRWGSGLNSARDFYLLVDGNDADNQNEDSFPVVKCTILSNLAVI